MSEITTPSRQSASRIGRHLKSGLTNYVDHWQEWIAPTLVAGAITVASIFCCWFPYLIVVGPVTCGMYCCALKTMRGGGIDVADLKSGWRSPGRAILAALIVNLGTALPFILFYGLFLGLFGVIFALAPEPQGRPGEKESPVHQQVAEAVIDTESPPGEQAEDNAEELASDDVPNLPEQQVDMGADTQQTYVPPPVVESQRSRHAEEPSPTVVFGMIAGIFIFYALLFLAIIVCWLWMLWFGTRTMFVLPLIADRQCTFGEAWSHSWRETRTRFWELVLINFVAGVLGMLGMYAFYIGLIFTLPIMFSIIVSVYDERFPSQETALKPTDDAY